MKLNTLTQDGPVGVITLDNGRKHNALSHTLVMDVIEALKEKRKPRFTGT